MEDQESQAFSLEDILKEFGSQPEEAPEITEPEAPPSPETGDTIRVPPISQPAAEVPGGDTIRFSPVSGDPAPPAEPEAPEAPEPFSSGWEPEYEQPMGEYVPPTPIAFHPDFRFRELKRKLVEGPEKRYYDLKEQGRGKLQLGILLCLLMTLLSGGSVLLYGMGMVPAPRLRLLVYGQVLAMLLAVLPGIYRLLSGISALLRGRFTLDTALVLTFLLCLADGILGLRDYRVPFCAVFCLEMTMALWAELQQRNTEMGQMDTLRRANQLGGIGKVPELYEEQDCFLRGPGDVEDFMDHYREPAPAGKVLSRYALAAACAAAVLGVVLGAFRGYALGIHGAAAALLAALPATVFVTLTRPGAVLEKRMHQLGAVLCGWQGVTGLCGEACVPISDGDLFPGNAVKLNGVKFFGSRNPDEVVAYGTALIAAEGGGLTGVFEQLLDSRSGRHYPVENLRSYASGGLGGEVCGEPVLVGVLSFMGDMGVEMPQGTRVNQAVYVAVDGELCGVFAISYERSRASAAGLATLCSYHSLTPVLTSRDFMLTESFLQSKFGINTRRIDFPDRATRYALSQQETDPQAPSLALLTRDGLAPMAFAITGARALRTASRMGVGMHLLAGILGFGLAAVLCAAGRTDLLSPSNLMLYELAWMVPGLLITEWTRTI